MNLLELRQYKAKLKARAAQRRELKKQMDFLSKQKDELFGIWVFKKAVDEDFVRKEASRVYLELKDLQQQYNAD